MQPQIPLSLHPPLPLPLLPEREAIQGAIPLLCKKSLCPVLTALMPLPGAARRWIMECKTAGEGRYAVFAACALAVRFGTDLASGAARWTMGPSYW
eukprot:1255022-Rhodomonas_salina.1